MQAHEYLDGKSPLHDRSALQLEATLALERAATLTGVKIPFLAATTPSTQQHSSSPTALADAFTTTGLIADPTAACNVPPSMEMPPDPPRTPTLLRSDLDDPLVFQFAAWLAPVCWRCCRRRGRREHVCMFGCRLWIHIRHGVAMRMRVFDDGGFALFLRKTEESRKLNLQWTFVGKL